MGRQPGPFALARKRTATGRRRRAASPHLPPGGDRPNASLGDRAYEAAGVSPSRRASSRRAKITVKGAPKGASLRDGASATPDIDLPRQDLGTYQGTGNWRGLVAFNVRLVETLKACFDGNRGHIGSKAGGATEEDQRLRVPGMLGEPSLKDATDATATVRRLLAAYTDTLDVLDGLPAMPAVATRWHWWSRPGAPIRLPRVSWMLRSLTLWHIDRVLSGAEKMFHRRSALGIAGAGEADALGAVAKFRASLPSRSKALRIAGLVIAALVGARLLTTLLLHVTPGHVDPNAPGSVANQLLDKMLSEFQLTSGSIGPAVDNVFKASPDVLALAALLLLVSLYLVMWPVASAFRLKRLLLNLYPHADSMRGSTPASWSVSRSTGVYSLERETFAMLGARVPSEPPLDLVVSLAIPTVWIYFGVFAFVIADLLNPVSPSDLLIDVLVLLLVFIPPAAIRFAWLAAARRARNGLPRSAWVFADEVTVPWRSEPVRCRSPLLIGVLSVLALFLFLIVGWLWRSTSRDLRDLGRAYNVEHLRGMHPAAQALAAGPGIFLLGVPALVVLFRAPRYISEAQAAIGLERPVTRHIAWLAPIWPVLCVLLQRELNRLWQARGMQVDEHTEPIPIGRR
jgi:hypothetical protein